MLITLFKLPKREIASEYDLFTVLKRNSSPFLALGFTGLRSPKYVFTLEFKINLKDAETEFYLSLAISNKIFTVNTIFEFDE